MAASLILARAAWSERTDAAVAQLEPDDPCNSPGWYRAAYERGELAVWEVLTCQGEYVGSVLWRTESGDRGVELVIVAAVSRSAVPGVDLTAATVPALSELARRLGCRTVRLHTYRPGMVRKALRAGFRVSETVMRLDVPAAGQGMH